MHHISIITLTPDQIQDAIQAYIAAHYPDAEVASLRFLDSQGRDVTGNLPSVLAIIQDDPGEGLGALGLLLSRAASDRPTPLVPLAPRPQLPGHGKH